ncbi:hypothetical protein CRD60_07945 [Bifidobacterium aemilianum]|uniref:Peptide ABC transporter permease n=2 Tax=Bifidobacterium aemilianum TaxID=2493120 RepID=A0A366K6D8_9BIFI|nr:hypothetical protein CRD60_07945 [Bifidobacterium aemilianum]
MVKSKRRVSPQQRRIYRRRRVVAAIALVLTLSLLIFCLYSLGRGIAALGSVAGVGSGPDLSRSKVSSPVKVSKVRNCKASDLQLELSTKSPSTEVGGSVEFKETVKYVGGSSCLINTASDSLVLTITSGSDHIWRSDVCPADSHTILMSKADNMDRFEQPVTWDAERSSDSCTEGFAAPKVDSGSYSAKLSLKGQKKAVSQTLPLLVE